MALNASGPISLGGATTGESINLENGLSATAQASLNDAGVRSLAGVPSGVIVMPTDFWGKSNSQSITISSNQTNLNLRTYALANGWNGSSALVVTINAGVYIYSTSLANAGLIINGSWPGGVSVINNGYIMGQGGGSSANSNGTAGAAAISLGVNVTIDSAVGYITGGGGGGGSSAYAPFVNWASSSGGGGGAGGGIPANITATNPNGYSGSSTGGSPGGPGAAGTNGTNNPASGFRTYAGSASGGGGGRIVPGTGGARTTATGLGQGGNGGGSGGGGGVSAYGTPGGGPLNGSYGGAGGSGSSAGENSFNSGTNGNSEAGGGGGWGAVGGNSSSRSGGAGGKAVELNGFTVTWTGGFPSTQVYGAVS